jgi:polyisoprenoid-binding protein YceI
LRQRGFIVIFITDQDEPEITIFPDEKGPNMKNFTRVFVTTTLFLLPALASASTWQIDPVHTNIQFMVRHLMISNVKGVFHKFNGVFEINDKDITMTKASAVIDVASIDTGIEKRDEDLRSANFFEVAKYPTMTFMSKKFIRVGANKFKMTGDLTIHGITREVVLDMEGMEPVVKDPWGGMRRGATLFTKINRKDFGLTYNKVLETGGVVVGDEVAISIEVEMVKK